MMVGLAIICILYGAFGWLGQLISGINYPMAQRLGLQESDEGTDPLFRRAEANAARWDSLVLWTLVAAGADQFVAQADPRLRVFLSFVVPAGKAVPV